MSEEDKELLVTRIIINETKETDRKRKRYIRGFERKKESKRERNTYGVVCVRRGEREEGKKRKNTPRMGARDVLSQESVRSVSTPGAVQWPRLCSGIKRTPAFRRSFVLGKE